MRIGIDARFYGPEESGLSRYIERLLKYLQTVDQVNEYIVFLRPVAKSWQPTNPRWRTVIVDVGWYSFKEQFLMPLIFLRAKLDLLHVPHFNFPILYPKKFVITFHDLILNEFTTERSSTLEPIWFKIKMAAYRFDVNQAIRRASRILTVSQHSETQLHKKYPVSIGKTTVTYESVDPFPTPVGLEALTKWGIKEPYLLYAGNAYPHKNLEILITAVKQMNLQNQKFQLVLAGKRDYFSRRLEQFAKDQGVPNVVFTGFVSDPELHRLYRNAQAYFFPSLSEGFGLPGLEAMSTGTPVYAAQASCLPEIFGTAAHYFDPHSVADISRAIKVALNDQAENTRLKLAGQVRIKDYSWRQMAEITKIVYDKAIAA
jgi:glycosyltransferase involved in cell wall biosynthesis